MSTCAGLPDPCPDALSAGISGNLFLMLLNTLLQAKCKISNKENYPEDYGTQLKDGQQFDFIVVGTGSAGSVVANKLSESGKWTVLALEAGHQPSATSEIPSLLFSLQGTEEDWKFRSEQQPTACLGMKNQTCSWPRGKCLGGSSSINAMLYFRGNKQDYDEWAALGNTGWNWDSVLPFFKANEDLQTPVGNTHYGKGGFQPLNKYKSNLPIRNLIEDAAKHLGYQTYEEETHLGYFDVPMVTEKGTRANTAKVFLGKFKERENLHVAMDATVSRLVIEDGVVKGVVIKINGKSITVEARKEVVLSAGSIGSPHILMNSGIGPREHLEELGIPLVQNLRVGENLQDHLFFAGLFTTLDDSAGGPKIALVDELYRYFMHQEGELAKISLTNFVGFINTNGDSPYPNVQLHHTSYPKADPYLLSELSRAIGIEKEIVDIKLKHLYNSFSIEFLPTLSKPKSRGRILLRSKDPEDQPLIYPNYLTESEDVETILKGIKYVEKLLNTQVLQKHNPELINLDIKGCKDLEFKSDDYWRCAIRYLASTVYHQVGTCKMGLKSDPTSVVDARLRIHGIKNLRVIDGSIMPTIVSVNTHGPIMMIGQKGATMIIEDWSRDQRQEL